MSSSGSNIDDEMARMRAHIAELEAKQKKLQAKKKKYKKSKSRDLGDEKKKNKKRDKSSEPKKKRDKSSEPKKQKKKDDGEYHVEDPQKLTKLERKRINASKKGSTDMHCLPLVSKDDVDVLYTLGGKKPEPIPNQTVSASDFSSRTKGELAECSGAMYYVRHRKKNSVFWAVKAPDGKLWNVYQPGLDEESDDSIDALVMGVCNGIRNVVKVPRKTKDGTKITLPHVLHLDVCDRICKAIKKEKKEAEPKKEVVSSNEDSEPPKPAKKQKKKKRASDSGEQSEEPVKESGERSESSDEKQKKRHASKAQKKSAPESSGERSETGEKKEKEAASAESSLTREMSPTKRKRERESDSASDRPQKRQKMSVEDVVAVAAASDSEGLPQIPAPQNGVAEPMNVVAERAADAGAVADASEEKPVWAEWFSLVKRKDEINDTQLEVSLAMTRHMANLMAQSKGGLEMLRNSKEDAKNSFFKTPSELDVKSYFTSVADERSNKLARQLGITDSEKISKIRHQIYISVLATYYASLSRITIKM